MPFSSTGSLPPFVGEGYGEEGPRAIEFPADMHD